MSKKSLWFMLITILVILVFIFAFAKIKDRDLVTNSSSKPLIKIGVAVPLSGDLAHMGNTIKGAIEVALQDANAKNNRCSYQAVFDDNQFSQARTATILNKHISIDHVDAVISLGSNMGNITSPITEQNKLIHFSVSSDPLVATGKYNFVNWTQPESETSKMLSVIKDKGYKNVAIVLFNIQGAIAVGDSLVKKLDSAGIKNQVLTVNSGMRDFRLSIQKLKNAGVDLYFILLYNPENVIFIKQLREAGVKADMTSIEGFSALPDFSIAEGAWYVDGAESENETMDRIKAHNKSDSSYGVGTVYDDVMLIVQAFETAPTKDKAVDALKNIKEYDGVVGHLTQDENGIFNSDAVVKHIKNGKIILEK